MKLTPPPAVGECAPAFVLPGVEGDETRLSDFRGRFHVLLTFYPFDFSPICSMQLSGLQEQMARFQALETVVLGISADSPLRIGHSPPSWDWNSPC